MSESPKPRLDPSVMAALIGVIGTIAVTLITLFYQNRPSDQATPAPTTVIVITATNPPTAVPTDTVPPGDPTSTPAPDTPTPEPTLTFTPIPANGQDWALGCISELWIPYPASIQTTPSNGCFSEPVGLFSASGGSLSFLYNGKVSSQEFYGLFTRLPADGTASLEVSLRDLTKGEIWMGVFAEPNIESSAGMLLVIPDGNVKNRLILQKTMPGQTRIDSTQPIPSDPAVYKVEFTFSSGSITARVPKIAYNFKSVAVPSSEKWLFIGYRVVSGTNRIEAEFLNLAMQAK